MKRIISIFLTLCLLMVLIGCSNTATPQAAPEPEEQSEPETPEEPEENKVLSLFKAVGRKERKE